MMFRVVLCAAAFVGLVVAEVPSYIHVCGAKNPNLDECIKNSVTAIHDKLITGIPELDIPSIEPLIIETVHLSHINNFDGVANNLTLHGFSDFVINFLHVDLKKQQFDLDISFEKILLEATFDVRAKILVEISGTGPIRIEATNLNGKARMTFKKTKRNGKEYIYFATSTVKVTIGDFTMNFKMNGDNSSTLTDAISAALRDSHDEILQATIPNVEKAISERILMVANRICQHFTYEELFPNRE